MDFVYDSEKIDSLLKNFYTLTKIKIVLYDNEFNVIATAPNNDCEFCAALSGIQTASEKCGVCTQKGITTCKKHGLTMYECHAGLTEAVMPIRIGDVIVGYIMLGQILKISNSHRNLAEYAFEYLGNDADKLLKSVVRKSEKEIKAAVKIMESCICYILMNKVIQEQNGDTVFSITKYIDDHLSENLTVSKLCQNFKISRNMLYHISDTYFGMPIATYIRIKKIQKAHQLLQEGLSVTLVAELTGYMDYGYFGKVFKAYTGITPTQAQKKSYS